MLPPIAEGLATIRRAGGNIDKAGHLRVITGFCNDSTAPRMPNQQYGTILFAQYAIDGGHIVSKRTQGILDHTHLETLGKQKRNDLQPTRAVGKRSVY